MFDVDQGGTLDADEFYTMGAAISEGMGSTKWTRAKSDKVFAKLDQDGSGGIDQDEFVEFYKGVLKGQPDAKFEKGMNRIVDAGRKIQQDKLDGLQGLIELHKSDACGAAVRQVRGGNHSCQQSGERRSSVLAQGSNRTCPWGASPPRLP